MCRPLIGVTVGDPAGVGPEIVLKAALDPGINDNAEILAIGPLDCLERVAHDLRLPVIPYAVREEKGRVSWSRSRAGGLATLDVGGPARDIPTGVVSREAGAVAVEAVRTAVDLALSGEIDAICTAPWNKEAVQLTDAPHSGHTEFIASLTGTDPAHVTMMLVHKDFHVFHVSTHVPLRVAIDLVTVERVSTVISLADRVLRELKIPDPRIAVAGLNPHAGEGGLFGEEDQRFIRPAINAAVAEGYNASGPYPADTIYWRALRGEFNGVVAMYHDQGHVAVKLAGMGHGVNVTVGTPILRTSVDHGTAFDIASQGVAEPTSLIEAVEVAAKLAVHRKAATGASREGLSALATASAPQKEERR